ncbi:MAG: Lrp/AsnC ligand binding domain-containing protein [Dehalococcoidia bacterium]|nr:Lrp/AsnC ligand binding domain-containing protein [Dehalococcoidia bacterium]
MAARAFVLIETSVGKTSDVLKAIEGFDGVKSVDAVTGPYDIIAVLDCPDLQAIGDLLTKHVHKIAGITRTVTCLCIKVS